MPQFSHRRVKQRRAYNVGEAARVTGVTPATVRAWIKKGLAVVPGIRPIILRGADIVAFLKNQRKSRKNPCGPGRLFCLSCKSPKRPAFGQVQFVADGPEIGKLVGRCPDCTTVMTRRSSRKNLTTALGDLRLSEQHAETSLSGLPEPRLNPHSEEV